MGWSDRRAFVEARALRHDLGLTPDQPAEPFEIAAGLDKKVKIVQVPVGEHDPVEGAFLRREGRAFILVNSSKWGRRQRFTVAHELGHFVLLADDVELVDTADQLDLAKANNADKREANLFAAELLMPEAGVRPLIAGLGPEDAVGAIARGYLVSPMSAAVRLSDCNMIDEATMASLKEVIENEWQAFWRAQRVPKDAKGSDALVLPQDFRDRADRLLTAGFIAPERHAELLNRPFVGSAG